MNRRVRPVRPSVSERGIVPRARRSRGREVRETRCERQASRRVISEVTGHGQLLLWRFRSPGGAGRLVGLTDVRARGEPSGLFVTWPGPGRACLCVAGFLAFLAFLAFLGFWVSGFLAASPSVLCSMSSMSSCTPLVSLMCSDKLRGRGRGRWMGGERERERE